MFAWGSRRVAPSFERVMFGKPSPGAPPLQLNGCDSSQGTSFVFKTKACLSVYVRKTPSCVPRGANKLLLLLTNV